MKELNKKNKEIIVGYYWWIFRINSFINFFKPYMLKEYADKYSTHPYHYDYKYYNSHSNNLDYHSGSSNHNYSNHFNDYNFF